ncbi:unnamed protein product [Brachionus calyciflorus]|uniref:HMG domain-containing protein n=1 Tax=Brachionus calyciflorus TaxID=104777 RepID=A0A814D8H5_9BILA|nr:unnamed protein product [Brachionus calyciflorus]
MEQFKNILKPFVNMDEMLSALNIIEILKESSMNMKTQIINSYLNKTYNEQQISFFVGKTKIYKEYYPQYFFQNHKSLLDFIELKSGTKNLMEFEYEGENCILCSHKLEHFTYVESLYYSLSAGSIKSKMKMKICKNCNTKYFLSFYIKKNEERSFFENTIFKKNIAFTIETIFEIKLLDSLTSDIIHKHSSFIGFCNAYNYLYMLKNQDNPSAKRVKLNDKRLCETWFLYSWNKKYFIAVFCSKMEWTNTIDGNLTFTFDGNLKVRRLKCLFNGLTTENLEFGTLQTGCNKVPSINNYLCDDHKKFDPQLSFNYGNSIYKCLSSQIKLKQSRRLVDTMNLVIHDAFECNKGVYYLVDYNDEYPFWASEGQIPSELIEKFEKKTKKDSVIREKSNKFY